MFSFIAWYLTITFLGWLAFPLVYHLFPAFLDRGYSLTRTIGLLLWGYFFWLLASLGAARNDLGGLLLALTVLAALSLWALTRIEGGLETVIAHLRARRGLVLTVEILFLLAFAFMAVVRATNPEAVGTEKPMDLAFINAILRSPTLPPHDPWLSGYAISYYYFGHLMAAMLARVTGVAGSVAFNLMVSLVFALSAVGAYGVLYNLLAVWRRGVGGKPFLGLPLLGPLFLLIVSNLEGFLEILHRRAMFWTFAPDGSATSAFWTWLDIKNLREPPNLPPGWVPDRFWWWWRASRVVQDYDLAGNFQEVIDEFPFFSYLLADLHPHVLAMPFGMLAVAAALHLFLDGWRGEMDLRLYRLPVRGTGFAFLAILLGGLAFLNTWDILIGTALVLGAYLLTRVRRAGWGWARLEDLVRFGLPLGVSSIVLYLPFYVGFSSQAGGVYPNLINPSRGAHLWVMFGSLWLPLLAYLVYLWRAEKRPADWRRGLLMAFSLALVLWGLAWLTAWVIALVHPDFADAFLLSQGVPDFGAFFAAANLRRLRSLGGLVSVLALLGGALAFLSAGGHPSEEKEESTPLASRFAVLLILLGALLVLAPEFFFLRDQFGTRMNTIFKFYYQAWQLWSLAAAFGTAVMLTALRGSWARVHAIALSLLLGMAMVYPVLGLADRTHNFDPPFGWTLDSAAHVARENPDEAAAIRHLQRAPLGVVAEAVGGSYTNYARISTHTGLPTVLGWPGHESQWRGGAAEQGSRAVDIETLYTTPDWETARNIIERYDIRYIVIGALERTTYHVNEAKFLRFLSIAFRQGDVVIYEVP